MNTEKLKKFFSAKRKAQIIVGLFLCVTLIIAACASMITKIHQQSVVTGGDTAHFAMEFNCKGVNHDTQ